MTISKVASAIVIVLLAGCTQPQVACGPALPQITASAPSTPASLAAPPGFSQLPAAAAPAPVPAPVAVKPPPNPLDNTAALGGR